MPAVARILLIDDDPQQCESLADVLEGLDCAVTACTDPLAALELSRGEAFDLVLIDLKLPGMSSLDLLRRVRPEGHRWIVLVAAVSDPGETEAALQAGADGVLEKPLEMERLRSWVETARPQEETPGAERSLCLSEA